MSAEIGQRDAERIENVLRTSAFFQATSTRRRFMQRILAAGGGVAVSGVVGAAVLGCDSASSRPSEAAVTGPTRATASPASDLVRAGSDPDPVTAFGNAAVGAERIGIAFYNNALGNVSPFGVPSDLAKGTLLNSAHRRYFEAAANQEDTHRVVLQSLGLDFPLSVFRFPAGTFDSAAAMLALGEQLESVFIGAYLGAIKVAASAANSFIAETAAQIVGIECEHRVLIRDIAGEDPPNDRFFEGDTGTPSDMLGNTGTRSVVYASGGDAVNALLALGITPVS
jgi:ferritin-like protein